MKDAQSLPLLVVPDSTPLWVLDDVLRHGRHEYALLVTSDGRPVGVVSRALIGHHASLTPQQAARGVPCETVQTMTSSAFTPYGGVHAMPGTSVMAVRWNDSWSVTVCRRDVPAHERS